MRVEHLLLVLGGVLLAAGLALGLAPVTSNGLSCGSALTGSSVEAFASDALSGTSCQDALSGRRTVAWVLLGLGVALAGIGAVVRYSTGIDREWEAARSR